MADRGLRYVNRIADSRRAYQHLNATPAHTFFFFESGSSSSTSCCPCRAASAMCKRRAERQQHAAGVQMRAKSL
eukprot:878489-Rhodomonas_salina.2